jgi:hypothetical protein
MSRTPVIESHMKVSAITWVVKVGKWQLSDINDNPILYGR